MTTEYSFVKHFLFAIVRNELENLGYKTKYGSSKWVQSTVIGIIKNEKYKGDLLLGKTFTVDPISKRRLENFGEEDKFYIRDHHEAIVSEEIFEEAQKILAKRNTNRNTHQEGQKRNKFSRKYAFSCMIKCGFCGGTLTRRNWHSSSAYTKTIWQCVTATKHGKRHCPHCKGIPEEVIENAFVKSYQLLCTDQQEVVDEFLRKVEGILNDDTSLKRLPKIGKEMGDLHRRKEKLLDLRLDNNIDRDIYEKKNQELSDQLKKLQEEQQQLMELSENQENTRTRLREFRKVLGSGEILESFDRVVFESVVEKIIIGGYNDEGVEEPLKIIFVYKTGIHSNFNGKDFKPKRKNAAAVHNDAELCSYTFAMVEAYWNIGKSIIEEQGGNEKAEYGTGLLKELSKQMTKDFGKGFTVTNLKYVRQFYLMFPNGHALRDELSWTHYRLLIKVENDNAREFYMQEAVKSQWSTRQLERQINSFFYERLLSSKNKEQVAEEIQTLEPAKEPEDIIRDPYVLEFLGLSSNDDFYESDLEQALITHLQRFLLELGRGFSFVARQKRITFDGRHFRIDLVFYNYILKCFVLIDLKVGDLTHQDLGQMQMYVHYFERELMNEGDNPPIGIVLCADKSESVVKYTLPENETQIFASKYKLYLPSEEELLRELNQEYKALEAGKIEEENIGTTKED